MTMFNWAIDINLFFVVFIVSTFFIPFIFSEGQGRPILDVVVALIIFANILLLYILYSLSNSHINTTYLVINFLPTVIIFSLGIFLQIRQNKLSKWLNSLDGKICVFIICPFIKCEKTIGQVGIVKYGPFILYMYYINGLYFNTLSLNNFKNSFSHIATEDEYIKEKEQLGFGEFIEKIVLKNKKC